eukprot:2109354-Alexandrium_andersonii.AAC.1
MERPQEGKVGSRRRARTGREQARQADSNVAREEWWKRGGQGGQGRRLIGSVEARKRGRMSASYIG